MQKRSRDEAVATQTNPKRFKADSTPVTTQTNPEKLKADSTPVATTLFIVGCKPYKATIVFPEALTRIATSSR